MILFNEALNSRYETLERNIKSKSNSYYDSYLDLLEATIKYFLDENGIEYDDSRTCGYIVKEDNIRNFLLYVINIDDYTYQKVNDYIKKCNDHKHKKEKNLNIESVINQLKIYFDLVNGYIKFLKGVTIDFDANYYSNIFGETERLNSEYKDELVRLKEELDSLYEDKKLSQSDIEKYKSILEEKDNVMLSLDEQNKMYQAQIMLLKDIKLNSLEEKLNKTVDMLNNMRDYLIENRIIAKRTIRLIDGSNISDDELSNERKRLEGIKDEQ